MVSKTSSGSVNVAESAVPSNQNERPPITRIAIKSLPTYQWEPTEHCPFRGSRDPLEKVREAVEVDCDWCGAVTRVADGRCLSCGLPLYPHEELTVMPKTAKSPQTTNTPEVN